MNRGGGVTILLLVLAATLSEASLNGKIPLVLFFLFFFFFFFSSDAASLVSLNLPYTLSVADVVSGPNCFPSQSLLPLCYQIAAQTDCRSAFPLVVAIVSSLFFFFFFFLVSHLFQGEPLQRRRFSVRVSFSSAERFRLSSQCRLLQLCSSSRGGGECFRSSSSPVSSLSSRLSSHLWQCRSRLLPVSVGARKRRRRGAVERRHLVCSSFGRRMDA